MEIIEIKEMVVEPPKNVPSDGYNIIHWGFFAIAFTAQGRPAEGAYDLCVDEIPGCDVEEDCTNDAILEFRMYIPSPQVGLIEAVGFCCAKQEHREAMSEKLTGAIAMEYKYEIRNFRTLKEIVERAGSKRYFIQSDAIPAPKLLQQLKNGKFTLKKPKRRKQSRATLNRKRREREARKRAAEKVLLKATELGPKRSKNTIKTLLQRDKTGKFIPKISVDNKPKRGPNGQFLPKNSVDNKAKRGPNGQFLPKNSDNKKINV